MSDNYNLQRALPTRLDIPAESRAGAIAILNQTRSCYFRLKTQSKPIGMSKEWTCTEAIGLTDDFGDADTADLYTEISRT